MSSPGGDIGTGFFIKRVERSRFGAGVALHEIEGRSYGGIDIRVVACEHKLVGLIHGARAELYVHALRIADCAVVTVTRQD